MLPYTNRIKNRDSRENKDLERSCTYDLLSVVVHVGEIETGHYMSYCRVGEQVRLLVPRQYTIALLKDHVNTNSFLKWFKFNDHKVELAKVSEVLGAQAYLLFYIIRSLA